MGVGGGGQGWNRTGAEVPHQLVEEGWSRPGLEQKYAISWWGRVGQGQDWVTHNQLVGEGWSRPGLGYTQSVGRGGSVKARTGLHTISW